MPPVENECCSLLEGFVLSLVNLLCVTQSNPAVSNSSRFSLLSAGRQLSQLLRGLDLGFNCSC